MVLFLFFCSGATALVYEVIWSKYLALMFGSTVYAQTVVLAVFMGGLALGNRLFGKRSDLLQKPLAAYGYIELIIGLYAFGFAAIYGAADGLFIKAGSGLIQNARALLVLKAVLSVALLIVPTVLMGGTLPLLVAWLNREKGDAGSKAARFYATNSLGAVFGSLMAGFFLVQWMGFQSALEMTALVNVVIGAAAILISRGAGESLSTTGAEGTGVTPGAVELSVAQRKLVFRGCLLVAATGAVSMGLEILAARSLALLFGASLQAFAIVLIAFILGIGIGSAIISTLRFEAKKTEAIVFGVVLAAATWIGLVIFNIESLFETYRHLKSGVAASPMGYRYQQLLTALVSIVVLGIPAALLGSVVPLWIRNIASTDSRLGNDVGRLLTWNTCGAVVGVIVTGFYLMPTFGLRAAFGILALILTVVAFIVVSSRLNVGRLVATGVIGCFVGIAAFTGGDTWQYITSSGVFRLRELEVGQPIRERVKSTHILFYEDAPDATVSVEAMASDPTRISLRINGKADASSKGDLSTQALLAHIPMAVKPDSKDVFVLGFGSGITAGALLDHPVESVTVAENCEPVLRAGEFFAPWNNGILTNSRARIWREDARTILKLHPKAYDIIICEPSNPWTAGVGSIFTKEFYEIAANRLKPGGVVCQWFHTYEMHDGIVFLVLRTFSSVFPHFEIWETSGGDIIMLGSQEAFPSEAEVYKTIFAREGVRRHLAEIGIDRPEALWARQLASQRIARAIPGEGPVQSDIFPVLEHEAPRAFFLGKTSTMLFKFDDRTWQKDIAPARKSAALSGLSATEVQNIFTNAPSVNAELNDQLRWYFTTARRDPSAWRDRSFPLVFRPADAPKPEIPPLRNYGTNVFLLTEGNALLAQGDVSEGIDRIERALQSKEDFKSALQVVELSGANAVRKALQAGDLERARRILELSLKHYPSSDQFNFLRRLIGVQTVAVK